jgi:hypothetical protein
MKLKNIETLSEGQFRRVIGVKRETFNKMVTIIEEAHLAKKSRGGRRNKLSVSEMLLMTLEYLREYRTYASIGASYGLSESNAFQAIRWVENVLIKCGLFSLPGKKALTQSDHEFEVILIDATESPIERPKKNSANSIQARKKDTL